MNVRVFDYGLNLYILKEKGVLQEPLSKGSLNGHKVVANNLDHWNSM